MVLRPHTIATGKSGSSAGEGESTMQQPWWQPPLLHMQQLYQKVYKHLLQSLPQFVPIT